MIVSAHRVACFEEPECCTIVKIFFQEENRQHLGLLPWPIPLPHILHLVRERHQVFPDDCNRPCKRKRLKYLGQVESEISGVYGISCGVFVLPSLNWVRISGVELFRNKAASSTFC